MELLSLGLGPLSVLCPVRLEDVRQGLPCKKEPAMPKGMECDQHSPAGPQHLRLQLWPQPTLGRGPGEGPPGTRAYLGHWLVRSLTR